MRGEHAERVVGEGEPPLVLLHGLGSDQSAWRLLLPYLTHAHRVVTFDHMGSGASFLGDYDASRYLSLEGYASDLNELLESLDIHHAVIVGHSVSGMIALLAAEQSSLIDRIVMIGGSARYVNDGDYTGGFERREIDELLSLLELDFQGWARSVSDRALDDASDPEIRKGLRFGFLRQNPEVLRQFAHATFLSDHRQDLAACPAKTLILQTSQDFVVPMSAAQYLADHIPHAKLKVLSARGHYPHLTAPQEVARAIEEFIQADDRDAS